jgi:hypothetical protein
MFFASPDNSVLKAARSTGTGVIASDGCRRKAIKGADKRGHYVADHPDRQTLWVLYPEVTRRRIYHYCIISVYLLLLKFTEDS